MNFDFIVTLMVGLLSLSLGVIVVAQDSKNASNRLFFGFNFFTALWIFSSLVARSLTATSVSPFMIIGYSSAALMAYFFLMFCLTFPEKPKNYFFWEYVLILLPAIFIILSALHLVAVITTDSSSSFRIVSGLFYGYYSIFLSSYIIAGLILLIIKFSKSEGIFKKQISTILFGFFLYAFLALLFNFVLPLVTNDPNVYRWSIYSIVFFLFFTAVAIIKYQLMEVKVILTETAVVILVISLIAQTLSSGNSKTGIINGVVLIAVIYGGYLIIKSVQSEIRQKEKLQVLSTQLEQANQHLKELDAMKTEFVSLASHELLTPVSAIEGYLSMLLDEKMARVDDPKAKKYLDNVYLSAKRLARLIADMLNISRIEEGRLSVEKSEVNVGDTIDQVIAEIRFKAEERKQKVVFNRDPQANYSTFADPDKIKEIAINIIGNSIKYSRDPGTITITVQKVPRQMVDSTWARIEADIKARPLDDQEAIKSSVDPHYRELVGEEQLMISVKDQGVGIPREELPRLFKKFHRVGNYSTQESQGTGLGLYISRALVELQHGRIWADSEGEGKGSTFTFTLPELAVKDQILTLEKEIPMDKEQMKPLARPMKSAAEEL